MKLDNGGTVPVYTVSGPSSHSLPDWVVRKKKKSLKYDPEFANRIELLQDFEFTGASSCIRVSDDGQWLMSTGTFPPQIHVHNLSQLSLSFARHTVSLNTKFVLCSSDYSKSIHLQEDRRIEFHTPDGCFYHVRIPRFGRDIAYERRSAEVLVPAAGLDSEGYGEVFRLNLEAGRFLRSYQIELDPDEGVERGLQGSIGVDCVNVAALAQETHGLAAFGTTTGTVEFWDPRSRSRIVTLQSHDGSITALEFSKSGHALATGSGSGIVRLYDLRRPTPRLTKDLGFGAQVQNLSFISTINEEHKIMAADRRAIKLFDELDGTPWASIEPEVDISCVVHYPDSGMLLSANEGPQQNAWFIPSLGPAPKWCNFLDRMVGEMAEETSSTTYNNYRFVTPAELRALALDHIVGKSKLIRPYMHGYFLATKLYDQTQLLAKPYEHEEERVRQVKGKVSKKQSGRLPIIKTKVNQKVVNEIIGGGDKNGSADVLRDGRFHGFIEDDEFAVDEAIAEEHRQSGQVSGMTSSKDVDMGNTNGERRTTPTRDTPKDGLLMRAVSSTDFSRGRDRTLGNRAHEADLKSSRKKEVTSTVSGGKQVTFVPQSGRKPKTPPENTEDRSTFTAQHRNRARRSASGNAFRDFKLKGKQR